MHVGGTHFASVERPALETALRSLRIGTLAKANDGGVRPVLEQRGEELNRADGAGAGRAEGGEEGFEIVSRMENDGALQGATDKREADQGRLEGR